MHDLEVNGDKFRFQSNAEGKLRVTMWPRLVANKLLGKSGCEPFNADGRDTESETEEEDVVPLPSKAPQRQSLLSSSMSTPPSAPISLGKPPKSPSPAASPMSSPSNTPMPSGKVMRMKSETPSPADSPVSSPSSTPMPSGKLMRMKPATHSPADSPVSSPSSTPMPSRKLMRMKSESLWTDYVDTEEYRVFVGTWNVAGKTPPDDLDLDSWLNPSNPSDIYVIGFQEIVPLKAGNVFGSEDMAGPAAKWDDLIRRTLNKTPKPQNLGSTAISRSSSAPSSMFLSALNSLDLKSPIAKDDTSLSKSGSRGSKTLEEELEQFYLGETEEEAGHDNKKSRRRHRYRRVASKQMVGIFISIWARVEVRRHMRDLKVSCVGCGIMGCLGNKGSISVSLYLHETSFCFVCTHLASGQKEGAEFHRNSNVSEILKRTIFPKSSNIQLPISILAHDRIIWFGDLNYRIALSDAEIRSLIEKEDWKTLLKSDQLRMELTAGRAFAGWHEGPIQFSPTYKYIPHSDHYCGAENKAPGERRSPAWCDRILWYGKGLKQISYSREEFRLSDHRPVSAIYLAEVEVLSNQKVKKTLGLSTKVPEMKKILSREIQKLSKTRHEGMLDSLHKINSGTINSVEQRLLPILNQVQANHNLELGTMLNQEIDVWELENDLKTKVPSSLLTARHYTKDKPICQKAMANGNDK